VNVWDISTGKKLLTLEGFNQVLGSIVVSRDERRLVTSNIGQEPIRFWDTESWDELLNLQGRSGYYLGNPRFLSDGNTLATDEVGLESGTARILLWRPPSWEEIAAAEAKEKTESKQP
jgi:WD40 repeat protein